MPPKIKNVYLRRRHNGAWQLTFIYTTPIFNKKTQKYTTRGYRALDVDEATANETLRLIRNQLELGLAKNVLDKFQDEYVASGVSIADFYELYIEHRTNLVEETMLAPSTLARDKDSLKCLFRHISPDIPMSAVTREALEKFRDQLRKDTVPNRGTKYKNTSVNVVLRTLRAAFGYAVKVRIIKDNPAAQVEKLPEKRPQEYIRVLTHPELDRLRQECIDKPPHIRNVIDFALNTLIREETIVTANIKNVFSDMVKSKVYAYGEEIEEEKERYFLRTIEKGRHAKGRKQREVPLNDRALAIIQYMRDLAENPYTYLATNFTTNLDLFLQRANDGYIFFMYSRPDSVSKMFSRISRKTKIDATFHDLRDTGATRMLESGIPVETVSHILGHSSVKVTLERYAKITRQISGSSVEGWEI